MEKLYNFKDSKENVSLNNAYLDSKEVGERGEQTVKNYLLSKPNIEEIVDVTKK